MAFRWFLGFSLIDKIPSYSAISQNKYARFKGINIYEKVFYNILSQAIEYGFLEKEKD